MTIRELEPKDYVDIVMLDLKEHDRLEAQVVYGVRTEAELKGLMLETVIFADEAYSIFLGDELIGAFGLSVDDDNSIAEDISFFYRPWLFTSERMNEINSITIARIAKKIVHEWAMTYGELYNVAMKDAKMIRWLEWLGFTIINGTDDNIIFFSTMKGE